jgi:UDP-N-acetylglucosamine 3-dehydrogenase
MNAGSLPRIGVIGLGFGAVHARVLGEMESVDLVALCDVDRSRLATVGRGRSVSLYEDYATMLAQERLAAVVVAVPTRLHEEVALAAIGAGVGAILVEKPIAPTLSEARRLAAAAEAADVLLMPGHVERFNPAIVELREQVRAGAAGKVLQISARRLGPFAARVRDVSVVHDLALHDIDVMRFVLGLEVERVFAESRSNVRTAFEDGIAGLLRFSGDGPVGLLDVNWLTPKKVRDLWLLGERGLFVADYGDALAPTLEFHETEPGERSGLAGGTWRSLVSIRGGDGGSVVRLPLDAREPLERELSAFVAAVACGGPMPVGRDDALAAIAVADALAESGRTGLPVRPERV